MSVFHGKLTDLDEEIHLPLLRRSYEDIIDDLPHREKTANKGDCGKVLIIAGPKVWAGLPVFVRKVRCVPEPGLSKLQPIVLILMR